MKLPQDLRDLTEEQRANLVTFYKGLPLKELRLRQGYNKDYRAMIKAKHTRFNFRTMEDDPLEPRLERAWSNTLIDDDLLSTAVFLKEFGG
jgi:hypothetical protein